MALDLRYAAARADAAAAEAAVKDEIKKASAGELKRLMRLSVAERFAALEKSDLKLTRRDRRELLRSLRDGFATATRISGGTASLWAIWRSRARYQLGLFGIIGVSVLGVGALAFVAHLRTPKLKVVTKFNYDIVAKWVLPDGAIVGDRLVAGTKYALYGRDGEAGILRAWESGVGYAEARVDLAWLQIAP